MMATEGSLRGRVIGYAPAIQLKRVSFKVGINVGEQ